MADPVVSISAVSSIGANFATLNGSITPNATSRAWRDGTASDTEHYFEFTDANGVAIAGSAGLAGSADNPFQAIPNGSAYFDTDNYPLVTTPVLESGSSPISIARVAYLLAPGSIYYVRLCARRYLFPGTGADLRYDRASQPYQLFHTASVTFTTL